MKKLTTVRKHLRKGKVVKAHKRNCDTKVRKHLKNFDKNQDGDQTRDDKLAREGHTLEEAKVKGVDMLKVRNHMRKFTDSEGVERISKKNPYDRSDKSRMKHGKVTTGSADSKKAAQAKKKLVTNISGKAINPHTREELKFTKK